MTDHFSFRLRLKADLLIPRQTDLSVDDVFAVHLSGASAVTKPGNVQRSEQFVKRIIQNSVKHWLWEQTANKDSFCLILRKVFHKVVSDSCLLIKCHYSQSKCSVNVMVM